MKTRNFLRGVIAAAFLTVLTLESQANLIEFDAVLNGSNETIATGSAGSGFGRLIIDDSINSYVFSGYYSGLSTPLTAATIQVGAPGTNGPAIKSLLSMGSSGTGVFYPQPGLFNSTQASELFSGLLYVNLHSSLYPGGEIRGQLVQVVSHVPEDGPGVLGLLAIIAVCALGFRAVKSQSLRHGSLARVRGQ